MPIARRLLVPLAVSVALFAAAPVAGAVTPSPVTAPAPAPAAAIDPAAPGASAVTPAAPAAPVHGNPPVDPLANLGGASPLCGDSGLDAEGKTNCLTSKTLAHRWPTGNYGLDSHVDVGITSTGTIFDGITQWLVTSVWMVLLYLMNAVLTLLDWAFALNLHDGLGPVSDAMRTMHDRIVQPWGLVAIGALALATIWNGLLRRKTVDTMRGAALSLAMMVGVLVVIANPQHTIGAAINTANGASKQLLNSVSGNADTSYGGLSQSERAIFDNTVTRPWCALQFGNVNLCTSKPQGSDETVADTWLKEPAGSAWRNDLYDAASSSSPTTAWVNDKWHNWVPYVTAGLLGGIHPKRPWDESLSDAQWKAFAGHPDLVSMQGTGSTAQRLALLVLIAVGMIGAIAMLSHIALRLAYAWIMFVILMLFGPAMFVFAGFGESGRLTVAGWAKRAVGSLATGAIYSLLLAVVGLGTVVISHIRPDSFFLTWLMFIAFWWGLFLHRRDLAALISLDHKEATPSGVAFEGARSPRSLMSELYFTSRLAGMGMRAVRRTAGMALTPVRAGAHRLADEHRAGVAAESDTVRDLAREELEDTARERINARRRAEHDAETERHQPILAEARRRRELVVDAEDQLRTARGTGAAGFDAMRSTLRDRRKELDEIRSNPAFMRAQEHAKRAPREASERDVHEWISDRRRQLARDPGDPANLWAAGIDPATPGAGDILRSREQMERDRELLNRIGRDRGVNFDRDTRARARQEAVDRDSAEHAATGDQSNRHTRDYWTRTNDGRPAERARARQMRHNTRRRRVR